MAQSHMPLRMRFVQLAIAFDQLVNTLIGLLLPNGAYADETLSARAWRLRRHPVWSVVRRVIDMIFFWQSDHCFRAYLTEMMRGQLPRTYQDTEQ